jgi:hypothetical protein
MSKALRAWRLLQRINPMILKMQKLIIAHGKVRDIKRLDDLFKRREIIRKIFVT